MGILNIVTFGAHKRRLEADRAAIAAETSRLMESEVLKIKAQLGYSGYGRSDGSKWPYGISGSGSARHFNHQAIRRNARDAYHDVPQAKALVDRYADTVADIGIMLEASPKADILGITDEQAEMWASDVESRFDLWARSKRQHRAENMTWYQSHRLYQIFQHRDNDVFVRLYYDNDKSLLNPLQFDFVDPDQVYGDTFTSTSWQFPTDDGISRDERGRETAYKIWVYDRTTREYKAVTIPAIEPRSNRVLMLHGFVPEYAGQVRGYSRLGHILQEFQDLTDFSLATIKQAINQSSISMYVKPSDTSAASNPLEGILTNRAAGPVVSAYGATPVAPGDAVNVTDESTLPVNYYRLPEATIDTPGSVGVFNLEKGEDLKAFEAKSPSAQYDKFVESFTSYISASSGMPLEVLLMKFNSNYSASRGALILFWRVAQIYVQEMAADYLDPIYNMWLAGEIAASRVKAPGWSDYHLRAAWLNKRWISAPMPNIDPAKTADADMKYVELGAATLDRVSRNYNGSSGKSNRAKLKREISELTQPPWANKGQGNGDGAKQQEKDEEE